MKAHHTPILDGIDPDLLDRVATRREALRRGMSASGVVAAGLALGSAPVALAALSRDLFAQAPGDVLDALQFAYVLENLENEFYRAVLGTSAVAAQNEAFAPVRQAVAALPGSAAVLAAIEQMQQHEQQHVDFLRETAIPLFGGSAPSLTANDFDFTGGNGSGTGPFARATEEPDFLLLVAQAVEDTGVRAYKGQAGRLLVDGDANANVALESALRIHSVEARHAAKVRRIRRSLHPDETALRWAGYVRGGGLAAAGAGMIDDPPAEVVAVLELVYGGATSEANTTHQVYDDVANRAATIDAATLGGTTSVIGGAEAIRTAATMAFDEPLTKEEVLQIVQGFIVDDPGRGLP